MIVFTGLSGSGKSSLAFDTIFAEGQRRYVESLSAYARQFLGQLDRPDVDFIDGLSPAVSIDPKAASRNPRSTVGTVTEVYDYLRLLFARVGQPHCPVCGRPVARQSPQQIVDQVLELAEGTRFQVLAPVVRGQKGSCAELLRGLAAKGYSRARVDGTVIRLESAVTGDLPAEERQARYRGRRGPAAGQAVGAGPAYRLGGDRALAVRRRRHPGLHRTCPRATRSGSGCSPSIWPACMTTCPLTSWNPVRSRSTRRQARARTAPAWAAGWKSTRS